MHRIKASLFSLVYCSSPPASSPPSASIVPPSFRIRYRINWLGFPPNLLQAFRSFPRTTWRSSCSSCQISNFPPYLSPNLNLVKMFPPYLSQLHPASCTCTCCIGIGMMHDHHHHGFRYRAYDYDTHADLRRLECARRITYSQYRFGVCLGPSRYDRICHAYCNSTRR